MDAPQKLEFPCDYPIKVMVRVQAGVREAVADAFERHAGPGTGERFTERPSAQANFAGLTYVIRATGPAQIEALFVELQQIPGVMLVL
jgi:putative lipoic acid-binding regulatory protein